MVITIENSDFDKYLSLFRYKFKNDKFETSGYTILKIKCYTCYGYRK